MEVKGEVDEYTYSYEYSYEEESTSEDTRTVQEMSDDTIRKLQKKLQDQLNQRKAGRRKKRQGQPTGTASTAVCENDKKEKATQHVVVTTRTENKSPEVQEVPKKASVPKRKRPLSPEGSSAVVTASANKKVKLGQGTENKSPDVQEVPKKASEPERKRPLSPKGSSAAVTASLSRSPLPEPYPRSRSSMSTSDLGRAKSPDSSQWNSASSSRALSVVAREGDPPGNFACVYSYVGPDADATVVAQDLRKHGPTILLMFCDSEEKARNVRRQLELTAQSAVAESKTGSLSRNPKEPCSRPEVQYKCVQFDKLVVGGRAGVVTSVGVEQETYLKFTCDPQFPLLIAEVAFGVSICGLTSITVAVAAEPDNIEEDLMPQLVELLQTSKARLLGCASERPVIDLATALRTKLTANVAAWQPHRAAQGTRLREEALSHYVFVLGPVSSLQVACRERRALECFTRGDEVGLCTPRQLLLPDTADPWDSLLEFLSPSEGMVVACPRKGFDLPVLPRVNQKIVQFVAPHTIKLQIFCGGRESRRTPRAAQKRMQKTQVRAEYWSHKDKPWAKRFRADKKTFDDHK